MRHRMPQRQHHTAPPPTAPCAVPAATRASTLLLPLPLLGCRRHADERAGAETAGAARPARWARAVHPAFCMWASILEGLKSSDLGVKWRSDSSPVVLGGPARAAVAAAVAAAAAASF